MTEWSIGSTWSRWDPHLHAPGTLRNDQFKGNWEGYLAKLESAVPAPSALGITDYFSLRTYIRVREEIERNGRLANIPLVFANVEMRLTMETKRRSAINVHLLVRPDDPDHIERMQEVMARLEFKYKSQVYPCGDEALTRLGRAYNDNAQLAEAAALSDGANQFKVELAKLRQLREDGWVRENVLFAVAGGQDGLGGLAHDDAYRSSREELGRFVDVVFSGNPRDRSFWLGDHAGLSKDGLSPRPCLHGSDAHDIKSVLEPAKERRTWIRGAPSWEGLRQALVEPERRVWIGPAPPQGPPALQTIKKVRVQGARWVQPAELALNDGLVTIIGSRGSGKTALVDLIAMGADADDDAPGDASFVGRAAEHLGGIVVELEWTDGEPSRRAFGETASGQPRVRYLSQQFVRRLTGDTALASGRDYLLEEMETVVFSAIPLEERLGHSSFDDLRDEVLGEHLVRRRNASEQIEQATKEIAGLRIQIANEKERMGIVRETKRKIAGLQKQIAGLASRAPVDHKKAHAAAVRDLKELQTAIAHRKSRATRLKALLAELENEVARANESHETLKKKYGELLALEDWELLKFQPSDTELLRVRDAIDLATEEIKQLIAKGRGSTLKPLADARAAVTAAEKKLDEDSVLTKRRTKLIRDLDAAEKKLEAAERDLRQSTGAKAKVEVAQKRRIDAYEQLFETFDAEADALERLYEPLRSRLNADEGLADLSFKVDITVDSAAWARRAEEYLFDLRRKPFHQKGALLSKASGLIAQWENGDASSVCAALRQFEEVVRDGLPSLRAEATYEDVGRWLFASDHIRVRYSIEFENASLNNLSPGTRGVVVLMLFLAIDDIDDRPLVIDQPEENLDPRSVNDRLVPFFRSAAKRRQIIMVTHNANLVVNGDSDQVIVAESRREDGPLPVMSYRAGGLEDPDIREAACQYLEGGMEAFKSRGRRYD